MAQKNRGRRDRLPSSKKPEETDTISRLTRQFRSREHMSYQSQSHPGDEELVRHLRAPYKNVVLGTES